MKPGLLLLLLVGAIAALFSAWWLLGDDTAPIGASGAGADAGTEMVTTLGPEGTLADVEARPSRGSELDEVDANRLGARTAGASPRGAKRAIQEPARKVATGPYTGRLVDALGRPMKDVEIFVESWEDASRQGVAGMQFNLGGKRKRPKGTTAVDGKFEVTSKDGLGRSLGITATVRGYSDAPVKCVLDPEKGRELGDVTLKPAVIVSGWVRDGDGMPVAGSRVRRIDRNGDEGADIMEQIGFGGLVEAVQTDADGHFELPHENEGLITLKIEGDDILTERWDGPTQRAGEVLQDIEVIVKRAGKIEGVVVGYPVGRKRGLIAAVALDASKEDGGGSGLSEIMAATLSPAGDHTTKIEADGSFILSGLVPGAGYRLRAITKNMFVTTVELSDAVDANAGGSSVSLQFEPGVTVTFQAVDRKTKRPVEAMSIAGKYGTEAAFLQLNETAGDPPDRYPGGKVTLYELRPEPGENTLLLSIDAEGYFRNSTVEFDVPESGTVHLGKVLMEPAPLLNFRVVDAVTRKPIRRARVTVDPMKSSAAPSSGASGDPVGLSGGDNEATDEEKEDQAVAEEMLFGAYRMRSRGRTDRKGFCPLTLVAGAQVSLEVKARGYASHIEAPFIPPVTASGDENEEIVIELYGGGALHVHVTDTENAPAGSVRVECRREAGGRTVKKGEDTDENGFAEFEHIAAGTWEVRAFRKDESPFATGGMGSARHPAEWVEVMVPRSAQARLDLQVPAVGDLNGIVLLGNRPSADAKVSLATVEGVDRAERMLEFQDRFASLTVDTTTGTSDFEGRFTLTDIVPGEYIILTRHPDLAMVVRTDVSVSVGKNSVTIELPSTSLEGRVQDDDGAPVVGAAVSVERLPADGKVSEERSMTRQFLDSETSATARTDINGVYKLLGVNADVSLVVHVAADGYGDARSESIQATTNETRTVPPIALERAGALVVICDDDFGVASMGFIRAKPTAGRALETAAMPKVAILKAGRARLSGLVSGTWEVTLEQPGGLDEGTSYDPQSIEIESGETGELEF